MEIFQHLKLKSLVEPLDVNCHSEKSIVLGRIIMVPKAGVEPARPNIGHYPLKIARLPIPPLRPEIEL